MKKKIRILTMILIMIFTISGTAQKEKNGVIYIEHPAIKTVEEMQQAFIAGDVDKVASYLADDFKSYNGSDTNKDTKGKDKESLIKSVTFWKENVSYLKSERSQGAYPDALEYKDSNNKDVVWVQTWTHLKGVHNKTGVKLDMPFHRLFVVNKDNKIQTMISYYDESIYDEIGESFSERTNGTIYNHHENINKVRIMVHAYENNDMETAYKFYDEKCKFRNIHMALGKTYSLEESKDGDIQFKEKFEINSIDVQGYPDYLNYGIRDSKVVQSWWVVRLTRKSDQKKINVPIMFLHDFNDEGMITMESAYYSAKLLED